MENLQSFIEINKRFLFENMLKSLLKDAQKQRVALFRNKSIKLFLSRRIIMRKLGKSLGSSNNNRLVCTFTLDNFRSLDFNKTLLSILKFSIFILW